MVSDILGHPVSMARHHYYYIMLNLVFDVCLLTQILWNFLSTIQYSLYFNLTLNNNIFTKICDKNIFLQ